MQLHARAHGGLGEWGRAREAWERLAALNRGVRAAALVAAADAARRGKDQKRAALHYATVLKEAPGSESAARAEVGLGHLHLARKEVAKAHAAFQRALQLPRNKGLEVEAKYWLAECLLKRHRLKESARQFEAVAKQAAALLEAPHAWFKAGTAYDLDGDRAAADRCYRALCKYFPDHDLARKASRRLSGQ
jgi:TolA-binding protein